MQVEKKKAGLNLFSIGRFFAFDLLYISWDVH